MRTQYVYDKDRAAATMNRRGGAGLNPRRPGGDYAAKAHDVMILRGLITVLVVSVCIAGLLAPVLIDAHHWTPRKRKKEGAR